MNNNDKIFLTQRERQVLFALHDKGFEALSHDCNVTLSVLERKGLVIVARLQGHIAEDAKLSDYGKEYIMQNPALENPVDFAELAVLEAKKGNRISTRTFIASIIGIIISLLTLIGCSRILAMLQ